MKGFAKYTTFIICVLIIAACSTVKYVPVKETEYVTVRDTTVLRDTTIQYQIEKEYVRDYTGLLDTLRLSTGLAEAESYVDTTNNVLTGSIRNKDKTLNIPTQYKERTVYRDSIVYKEVPVPVEVTKEVRYIPWWAKVLSWIGGLSLAAAIIYILLKIGILKIKV